MMKEAYVEGSDCFLKLKTVIYTYFKESWLQIGECFGGLV